MCCCRVWSYLSHSARQSIILKLPLRLLSVNYRVKLSHKRFCHRGVYGAFALVLTVICICLLLMMNHTLQSFWRAYLQSCKIHSFIIPSNYLALKQTDCFSQHRSRSWHETFCVSAWKLKLHLGKKKKTGLYTASHLLLHQLICVHGRAFIYKVISFNHSNMWLNKNTIQIFFFFP